MSHAEPAVAETRRIPPAMLHLAFFSILFLMLAVAAPTMSWGSGSCTGTLVALEGPLLPAAV